MDDNERYFEWLLSKTGSEQRMLCIIMHDVIFFPLLEMDTNRWEDGMNYRETYSAMTGADVDEISKGIGGCTMLELVLSLAEHMSFDMQDSIYAAGPAKWFQELIDNLGLDIYTDDVFLSDENAYYEVMNILERVVFRRYDCDGTGGLFPLDIAYEDQRRVELEIQRNTYMMEKYDILGG